MTQPTVVPPELSSTLRMMTEKISSLKAEIIVLDQTNANQNMNGNGTLMDDLEADLNTLKAEIDVLKHGVPEGNPEERNMNFFLSVAELQKLNEGLRHQLRITEKNILSTSSEIKETLSWTNDIEMMMKKIPNGDNGSNRDKGDHASSQLQTEALALDNKYRKTRNLYKEFKMFFAKLLEKLNDSEKDEDSSLAILLQFLWNQFQDWKDGKTNDAWVKISHLDFDVDPQDITRLLRVGIIEVNPEDEGVIRMIDFTD